MNIIMMNIKKFYIQYIKLNIFYIFIFINILINNYNYFYI